MDYRRAGRAKHRVVRKLYGSEEDERKAAWPTTSDSDTSQSDTNVRSSPVPVPVPHHGGYCSDSSPCKVLPPIGVFWDIENCQIPRGRSAVAVAQAIRDKFFDGYREAEFLVVCDVKKETSQIIQELNDAQVNLIHVGSHCKNAADDKLRQSIRRFADIHGSQAAIVLISGDINFAPDLCDLRHRKKIHVILVHNDVCSESLILCANEHYKFSALVASLPFRGANKLAYQPAEVTVTSLPSASDPNKVRMKLKRLAENCGGRVGLVQGHLATVRFPSFEYAIRAQKRMDGEIVFGSQICVSGPTSVRTLSPLKRRTFSRRDENGAWEQQDTQPWNNVAPQPFPRFFGQYSQDHSVPVVNQENVPVLMTKSHWGNLIPPQVTIPKVQGRRPILGRRNDQTCNQDYFNGQNNVSGRHSLDSMLDSGGDRPCSPGRRCHTPTSCVTDLGVNTSMPPPPIVNLPRSNGKYLFQPIPVRPAANSQPSELAEPLYCRQHSHLASCSGEVPSVTVLLPQFTHRLISLVVAHDNALPLASLADCYAAQFEPMVSDGNSVPLEHLVTCVAEIQLAVGPSGKHLRLQTPSSRHSSAASPRTADLSRLANELVDLLKAQPRCQILFDRLIQTFSQHYGRQCRVADYGCTRLMELMSNLQADIQVIGEGSSRVVTLTHKAQTQRFNSDLLRVLRSQASKQLLLRDLSSLWQRTLGHGLEPSNYGLCYLQDLLSLVPADCVQMTGLGYDTVLALPRRPPTQAEKEKIKTFATQMVELLSTMPDQTIEFSRLIPSYHQYFKVQCRVADYGCTKLAELLDAIPHVVKVTSSRDGVLLVNLVDTKTLILRTLRILWDCSAGKMSLLEFQSTFQDYYQTSCPRLTLETQLRNIVKVTETGHVQLCPLQLFARDVYRLLCDHNGRLPLTAFEAAYQRSIGTAVNPTLYGFLAVSQLLAAVDHVVTVSTHGHSKALQLNGSLADAGITLPPGIVNAETKSSSNQSEPRLHPSSSQTLLNGFKSNGEHQPQVNGVLPLHHSITSRPTATGHDNKPKPTLLSPAEFLRPVNLPAPPDPSMLPLPPTKFTQGNDEINRGSFLLMDCDVNDINKRKLRLAAFFNSPIQLK